jgi:uncharacterized protein
MTDNVAVILDTFRAVEQRDQEALLALCDPEVEFHWPPSLPYGGAHRGAAALENGLDWSQTWEPLQTDVERQMDPRVIAAGDDEVVVLWRQRGIDHAGHHIDSPVLGLYRLRDGKLARAQMFYFDTVEVLSFLGQAKEHART